jgi:hypothetical protein
VSTGICLVACRAERARWFPFRASFLPLDEPSESTESHDSHRNERESPRFGILARPKSRTQTDLRRSARRRTQKPAARDAPSPQLF